MGIKYLSYNQKKLVIIKWFKNNILSCNLCILYLLTINYIIFQSQSRQRIRNILLILPWTVRILNNQQRKGIWLYRAELPNWIGKVTFITLDCNQATVSYILTVFQCTRENWREFCDERWQPSINKLSLWILVVFHVNI